MRGYADQNSSDADNFYAVKVLNMIVKNFHELNFYHFSKWYLNCTHYLVILINNLVLFFLFQKLVIKHGYQQLQELTVFLVINKFDIHNIGL